jgi:uncharacterized membrane protein
VSTEASPSTPDPASATPTNAGQDLGAVHQNVDSIAAFLEREQQKVSSSQRHLEVFSGHIGSPIYLVALLSFVGVWVASNWGLALLGRTPLDPPPFAWLQGWLTLTALVTATVVVAAQNRQAKLESQRAHLDLQLNLLTEQKVTKLIHLIEELRRDLPMVRDRHDPVAAALQQPTDTAGVLSALESGGIGRDGKLKADGRT